MISFWTKEIRPAESILGEQDQNARRNDDTLLAMRSQAVDLVTLLSAKGSFSVEKFGRVVHEGWLMKRKLASKVTNSTIDKYYEIAVNHGAYGGKISGAGGGGFLNVFAAASNQHRIVTALNEFGLASHKFNFETRGTTVTEFV
jgi:D-glycero-alpha-D-manno-heptose-7-phosphate kinase